MADGRNITVSTALGDKLLFAQMEGFDEISRCFRYETGLISKDIDIKAEDILGTPVTITVRPPNNPGLKTERYDMFPPPLTPALSTVCRCIQASVMCGSLLGVYLTFT